MGNTNDNNSNSFDVDQSYSGYSNSEQQQSVFKPNVNNSIYANRRAFPNIQPQPQYNLNQISFVDKNLKLPGQVPALNTFNSDSDVADPIPPHEMSQSNSGGNVNANTNTQYKMSNLSAAQITLLNKQQAAMTEQQERQRALLNIFTGESMEICWVFWKDNVDILPRNKQKELALLLYSHIFQKIPAARRLFVKGVIDTQALKFLDMFGFLIRQLKDPDQGSLITTLQGLGQRHRLWGVRNEYFEGMMISLHCSLSDHFKHTYTVRVKFCMEQLFACAANVMTSNGNQNLRPIVSERYDSLQHLDFLRTLEMCWAHETGREYLERFLTQSFCAEMVAFHEYYKDYRGALSDTERYIYSSRIVQQCLRPNGKHELTIPNFDLREDVLKRLQKLEKKAMSKKQKQKHGKNSKANANVNANNSNSNMRVSGNMNAVDIYHIQMPVDLFDPIYEWMMNEVRENNWIKFRDTILSIAVNRKAHK